MAIEIKQRVGSSLLPVPLGCDCSGGGSGGGSGVDAGELAAIRQELAEVAGDVASASRDAASAIGLANDAAGAAESAAEAAAAAGEKAAEALSAAGSIRQANATIYLGGSGASDVLCDGRGLVSELPFETMTAALAWVKGNIRPSNLTFLLQGDVDNGTNVLDFTIPWAQVAVKSKSGLTDLPRLICGRIDLYGCNFVSLNKISIECPALPTKTSPYCGCIGVNTNCAVSMSECAIIATPATSNNGVCLAVQEGANLYARECKFVCNNIAYGIFITMHAGVGLRYENEFSGTVNKGVFGIEHCSSLSYYTDGKRLLSGDVTGKKYTVTHSSTLHMRNATTDIIPGSVAGVCDTSSTVYAA